MHRLNKQTGATLIEILVSILVISFGILAMAAVQSNSVRFHKTTEYRATATLLAADLADRMRANNAGTSANQYEWPTTTYTPLTEDNIGDAVTCGESVINGVLSTPCTANTMAAKDLWEWKRRLSLMLPGASGHITAYDATRRAVDMWIAWQDPSETDSSGTSTAVSSAECPSSTAVGIWTASTPAPHCLFLRVAL